MVVGLCHRAKTIPGCELDCLNYNYKWGHLYYTYNFASSSFGKTSEHDFMT